MHRGDSLSIFSEYYQTQPLVDRFQNDRARAVDVIIPIIHTNEMWRANLLSIYREIPVNRLILGDGGCIDDSLDVAREFPRVEELDHRNYTSLGYSLRHLIEATRTEWFVYLHSDVYLPAGWFDIMSSHRNEFDWFECNQRITVMADYLLDTTKVARSYSGSQMGRKAAFERVTPLIDDDFLYRNEDIILAKLMERAGGRYGKVGETHHFHQVMYKPSRWHRAIKRVMIEPDIARDEDIRANRTYAQGIIKYLDPAEVRADRDSVRMAIDRLIDLEDTTGQEFLAWVGATNPKWVSVLSPALVGPAVSSSKRDHIADRIQQFAALYRVYGGPGAVLFAVRYFLARITRSFLARGRIAFYWVRGASRKLVMIFRTEGILAVARFLKQRVLGH
jgi:hypothetical protein